MKEVKNNESDMESALKEIELLEQKKEFSCGWNHCHADNNGGEGGFCSEVSCTMDFD